MENQRRSFRLDVEVGFEARLVNEDNLQSGIDKLKQSKGHIVCIAGMLNDLDAALHMELSELQLSAPKAASIMTMLNRKIDLLSMVRNRENDRKEMPMRRINLSATGMAFDYRSQIEEGRALHCTLMLPSTGWLIELYARVVTARPNSSADGYKICLDYLFLSDDDREKLIRFNLQEQQRQLAMQAME